MKFKSLASVIVDRRDEKIIHLIRPGAPQTPAQHVSPGRGVIRLDAMESPYTWPAYLRGEWTEEMQSVRLNRYPDPASTNLKARLREVFDLPPTAEIMVGNGSEELVQILSLAFKMAGQKVLAPVPSFTMYQRVASIVGLEFVGVPLRREDFGLDVEAMLAAIEEHQPAIIYLASPNNPTGNIFDEEDILKIVEASKGLVVVDEAFQPFSSKTLVGLIEQHSNLMIMRSLSKMGLAGLRLGFLVGSPEWMARIKQYRLPFNIDALSQFTAEFVLGYFDVFEEQIEQTVRDRAWVAENIRRLNGLEVFPSEANFLMMRAEGRGNKLDESLRDKGIWVKNLSERHPLLKDCLRVTIGKPSENVAFLSALTSSI